MHGLEGYIIWSNSVPDMSVHSCTQNNSRIADFNIVLNVGNGDSSKHTAVGKYL